jgi:hypothetical protein
MTEMIRVKLRLAEGTDNYVIHHVSKDDEGRYFCRVTNSFGTKEAFVDLRMLGQLLTLYYLDYGGFRAPCIFPKTNSGNDEIFYFVYSSLIDFDTFW